MTKREASAAPESRTRSRPRPEARAQAVTTRELPPAGQAEEQVDSVLPTRTVTINQVVARNMALARRRREMTQDQLGQVLTRITGRPWSNATVSSAERSWGTDRIRQFDADDLIALAQALQIPVTSLLLPPPTDGVEEQLVYSVQPLDQVSVASGVNGAALLEAIFGDEEAESFRDVTERVEKAFSVHSGDAGAPSQAFPQRPPLLPSMFSLEIEKVISQLIAVQAKAAQLQAAQLQVAQLQAAQQSTTPSDEASAEETDLRQHRNKG